MSGIKIKGQERKDQGGCAWSGEITAGHVDPRCWIPVAGDQYGEWLGDASDWGGPLTIMSLVPVTHDLLCFLSGV